MTYFVELDLVAEKHLAAHIKAGNKILLKKISKLLLELEAHPETGTGKPEKLKYKGVNYWSRRINSKHRMEYIIDNDRVIVFVIALWGHYDDK
jgi:toxin YoeB